MKRPALRSLAWFVLGAAVATLCFVIGPRINLPLFGKWLSDNPNLAGWAGVAASVIAIFGAALSSLFLFRHQQDRLAAEKMTAIYVVASAAGREITLYDRLNRDEAAALEVKKANDKRRARIIERWDAWIVNRLTGLANLIDSYQATGAEGRDFMQHLLTIQGRLRWLAKGAGLAVAKAELTNVERVLLETAAYEVVKALLDMRRNLDAAREGAWLPTLETQKVETASAGLFVLEEPHRPPIWADSHKI